MLWFIFKLVDHLTVLAFVLNEKRFHCVCFHKVMVAVLIYQECQEQKRATRELQQHDEHAAPKWKDQVRSARGNCASETGTLRIYACVPREEASPVLFLCLFLLIQSDLVTTVEVLDSNNSFLKYQCVYVPQSVSTLNK